MFKYLIIIFLIIGCNQVDVGDLTIDENNSTNIPNSTNNTSEDSSVDLLPSILKSNICDDISSDWVFCSGFEEGNKDIWDDYDGNPDSSNLLVEDPGPFNIAGNHVMQFIVAEGRGGADLVKILPSSYDQIYARWYIKWRDGYNFNDHNHGGGLHAGGRQYLGRSDYRPAGDDWFSAWIEPDVNTHTLYSYSYYRGMYMNCADPSGSCWGDMFPCTTDEGRTFCEKPEHREQFLPDELEDNRWYCVEMFLDGGVATSNEANATGKLNFWVDGVEMGAWDNLWFRTNDNIKINTLWLNLFHHGEHSPAGVMYDHVAVSTQRIGCY